MVDPEKWRAEFPKRKNPPHPRRTRLTSATTTSTGSRFRDRSVSSRIRLRTCSIACFVGHRARKRTCRCRGDVARTQRWWKPRKSRPSPPSTRWTIRVFAALGSSPRPARIRVTSVSPAPASYVGRCNLRGAERYPARVFKEMSGTPTSCCYVRPGRTWDHLRGASPTVTEHP